MTGSQSDWGERSLQRGGYRRQGDTGRAEQLERPVSARCCEQRKKVGRITGSTGKAIEVERESDGLVLAMKRSNARGAKGPWCVRCFRQEGRQAG
jgi:hypothetical protein